MPSEFVEIGGKKRFVFKTKQPSKTDQSQRQKVNINSIMKKALRTGFLPVRSDIGQEGDFASGVDFHACMNAIARAKTEFERIPAEIRNLFDNDYGNLVDFLGDENNRSKAEELGLIPKAEVNAVETIPEPPAEPES